MASTTNEVFTPLLDGLKKAFTDGVGTDVKIKCGEREWNVHKIVISSWSPVFSRECYGNFKEAKEDVIPLKSDDPQVVAAMLYFMYHADYADADNDPDDINPLVFNVRVYVIADKYDIPALAKLAADKFAVRAHAEWNSEGFADAAAEVYNNDVADRDRLLSGTIIKLAEAHAHDLLSDANTHFSHVANSVPALATELARKLANRAKNTKKYACPSCQREFFKEGESDVTGHNRSCTYCGHRKGAQDWENYLAASQD